MISVANFLDSLISPVDNLASFQNTKDTSSTSIDFQDILNEHQKQTEDKINTDINNLFQDVLGFFRNIINVFSNNKSQKPDINIDISKIDTKARTSIINILKDIENFSKDINPNFDTKPIENIIKDIKNPKPSESIFISISVEEFVNTNKNSSFLSSVISNLDKYIFSNKEISAHIVSFSFEIASNSKTLLSLKAQKPNVETLKDNTASKFLAKTSFTNDAKNTSSRLQISKELSDSSIKQDNISYKSNFVEVDIILSHEKTQINPDILDNTLKKPESIDTEDISKNIKDKKYDTFLNNAINYKTSDVDNNLDASKFDPVQSSLMNTQDISKYDKSDAHQQSVSTTKDINNKTDDTKAKIEDANLVDDIQKDVSQNIPKQEPMGSSNAKSGADASSIDIEYKTINTTVSQKTTENRSQNYKSDAHQQSVSTTKDINNKTDDTKAKIEDANLDDVKDNTSVTKADVKKDTYQSALQQEPQSSYKVDTQKDEVEQTKLSKEKSDNTINPSVIETDDKSVYKEQANSFSNTKNNTRYLNDTLKSQSSKNLIKDDKSDTSTTQNINHVNTSDATKPVDSNQLPNIKTDNIPSVKDVKPQDNQTQNIRQNITTSLDDQSITPDAKNNTVKNQTQEIIEHIAKNINALNLDSKDMLPKANLNSLHDFVNPVKDLIKETTSFQAFSTNTNDKQKDSKDNNQGFDMNYQQNLQNTQQSNANTNTINADKLFKEIEKTVLKEVKNPVLMKNVSIELDDGTALQIKFNANSLSIAISTNTELTYKDYQIKDLVKNLQNLGFSVENITINGATIESQMGFSENKDQKKDDNEKKDSYKSDQDFELVNAV